MWDNQGKWTDKTGRAEVTCKSETRPVKDAGQQICPRIHNCGVSVVL